MLEVITASTAMVSLAAKYLEIGLPKQQLILEYYKQEHIGSM